jgi:monovalent cation:H+ antiporter-2, CPA2 family
VRLPLPGTKPLARIGEFSIILAAVGLSFGLLSPEDRNLIPAGAIASITLNSLVFRTRTPCNGGTPDGHA